MYILHIPILWWAVHWGFPFGDRSATCCGATSFGAVYHWIEEPANRWLRAEPSGSLAAIGF